MRGQNSEFQFKVHDYASQEYKLFPIPKDWFKLSNTLKDYAISDKTLPLTDYSYASLKLIHGIVEEIRINHNAKYVQALNGTLVSVKQSGCEVRLRKFCRTCSRLTLENP